jgi:diguanylate cyclase (GGDEF)-like protein/PAS domain S-box-containing protein
MEARHGKIDSRQATGSKIARHDESLPGLGGEISDPILLNSSPAILKIVIAALLAGAVASLVGLYVLAPHETTRAIGPVLVALVAATGWYFISHGRMRAGINVLAYGIWLAVTGIAVVTDGVRAPIVIAYPLIILMVGWLISTRAALTMAALSVTATVGLVWAQARGVLPAPLSSLPAMHGIDQVIVYILSAVLIVFLVRAYQSRLQELRRIGSDLARRSFDLEASKAELHQAQAVAKVGSWVFELVTDTLRMSAETCRIFGLAEGSRGSLDAYLAGVHPDDRGAVDHAWQAALTGRAFDHEHRILVGDTIRWVRQKAVLEFTPDGAPLRALGIAQDITERKQAQLALQDSEERYRTMIEWSPEPVLVHRLGKILYANSAASKLFGASDVQSLLGKFTFELIHPDFLESQAERMRSINDHAPIKPMVESRFLKLDGAAIDVEVQGTSIVYDGESAIHVSIRDITDRKQAEEKIRELAFYDQLTGLPNRTLLLERLRQTKSASSRSGNYGALLFIDLDNFKTLNDTLGHDMGDVLLKQVAHRLAACVRAEDTLGRLGGDEFVVLLANLSTSKGEAVKQAEAAGEKIRVALNQSYPLGHITYHSTPSIGATLFMGYDASVDSLLKQADLAMYKSKAAGRNALRFFNPAMEAAVMARAALEADLRVALREQQFLLHYQAQIAGEGVVVGAEVLVRWQHPQRGLVPPAEFIPLAEDAGLILPLGLWVLETACAQLTRWAAQAELAELTLAVNVSARQFRQPDFVEQIQAVLRRTGANPQRLKLELTESLLLSNVEDVIAKMSALKEDGIGFSLDDFGTGYSSLAYLSRLPLDQLKIDRSFVMNIESSDNAVAICAATISLAHGLKLKVVAEGVETEAQRYLLQTVHHCDLIQGDLFSRALPLAEFESYAART